MSDTQHDVSLQQTMQLLLQLKAVSSAQGSDAHMSDTWHDATVQQTLQLLQLQAVCSVQGSDAQNDA